MKKFIRIILVMTLLRIFAVSVNADEGKLDISAKPDMVNGGLVVSGTVESNKLGVPIVFIIEENNEIIWVEQIITNKIENGKSEFEFETFLIPGDKESTVYKITVSAQFIDETDVLEFSYAGIDKRFEILKKIAEYDKSASVSGMRTDVIEVYFDELGIDRSLYNNLQRQGKDIIAKIVAENTYECPSDYSSEANIKKINESLSKFVATYNEAFAIACVTNIDNEQEFSDWVNTFGKAYDFSADEITTNDDEAKMYSQYFDKITKSAILINRIKQTAAQAKNFKELKNLIFDKVFLTYIEASNYTKTKEIVETFPEKFKAISAGKKVTGVYMAVTGKYYETIKDFCDACNNTTVNQGTNSFGVSAGSSGSSGSSGGGGGGGSKNSGVVINGDLNDSMQAVKNTFSDMGSYSWALEAVNYLYGKGIVSGKSKTEFAPGDSVTRAEFAKILVNAMSVEVAGYNNEFTDVFASEWYAPYVSAAAQKGIIMGSDGKFMPNDKITRQDMALMIKRALNLGDEGFEVVFEDSEKISGYAQKAVYAIYKKGIMKGAGDGFFNPLMNASRAEAAQTVYNMLNKR